MAIPADGCRRERRNLAGRESHRWNFPAHYGIMTPVYTVCRLCVRLMRRSGIRWLTGLSLLVSMSACGHAVPVFDQERAFADLEAQTAMGPRIPGTDGHRRCAVWITNQLTGLADSVWSQPFIGVLPGRSDSVPMTNIIARFAAGNPRRVLVGAHWDTRPQADQDADSARRAEPVPGANDGASGVAVLLEIARAMTAASPPIGVDLVFFDGEDAGSYGKEIDWAQGARYFAAHLPVRYDWVIIVDMVGDKDLELYREGYSYTFAREFQDRIWALAAAMGETAFLPGVERDLIDDHLPFLMRGIPAVDIIDIRYPYWHTTQDTPDKCSPASLGTVGRVVLRVLYDG